jgi:IS30 family transposase
MHHSKESITKISQVLGRNKGTISRELSRNAEGRSYSANGSQNSYTTRRLICKPTLKVMKPENHARIVSGLEQYWSPEQIIGHHGMKLCTATIYRALKNGLLRQFFPKYTSFLAVTQEDLDHAIHLLNNRPRKCLDWKTPYQAFAEELLHLD